MPNIINRLVTDELKRELTDVEGMLLVSFGGLTVKETEGLRNQLAEKGARFKMVRNSLAKRVLSTNGFDFGDDVLSGNVAIAYGPAEATIGAAKVLTDKDVKKAGKVKVRGGMLEGNLLGPKDARALADVPDRDSLNAMMLGVISGPARGIVGVLNAPLSGLARLLQARADQLAEGGGDE